MKAWRREPAGVRCGRCGQAIARGAVVLVYTFVERRLEKVRCASCAGEPAPHLPALVERESVGITPTPITKKPERLARVGQLAADWKLAQSGEAR